MTAEVPWWTRTTKAGVKIRHDVCGGTIGTAGPLDAGGLTIAVNEHLDPDDLDEMRQGVKDKLPRHGQRHLIVDRTLRNYRSTETMPTSFEAWCIGCAVSCAI